MIEGTTCTCMLIVDGDDENDNISDRYFAISQRLTMIRSANLLAIWDNKATLYQQCTTPIIRQTICHRNDT